MTSRYDAIDVGDFDREYDLSELFPADLAEELLSDIDGNTHAVLLLPDGSVYYPADGPSVHLPMDAAAAAERFDLVHELEIIGTLVLAPGTPTPDSGGLQRLGGFLKRTINRMIDLNYRNRMAAGLHGQVVTDSYARLREKAEQLARSEARYRKLSEDLEIEVEKKTRQIRDTHLVMMQQEKMAAVGQLAAGMAHEINNPIGFVISNLNSLKAGCAEMALLIARYRKLADLLSGGADARAAASRIRAQLNAIEQLILEMDLDYLLEDTQSLIDESLDGAGRIKSIVENMRDFTHPSVETTENVNFNESLETTLAILSARNRPGVRISCRFDEIPTVNCHLREINHVFFHILKNALQAVADGGEIRIRTAVDRDAVLISVADTGPGIPRADQDRIFEPFFTTRTVGEGTGLGLFHAHNIVHSLGGTITVASDTHPGSTFTVRIPRVAPQDPAPGAPSAQPPNPT